MSSISKPSKNDIRSIIRDSVYLITILGTVMILQYTISDYDMSEYLIYLLYICIGIVLYHVIVKKIVNLNA